MDGVGVKKNKNNQFVGVISMVIQKRDSLLFSPFTVSEKGKKVDCPFFELIDRLLTHFDVHAAASQPKIHCYLAGILGLDDDWDLETIFAQQ